MVDVLDKILIEKKIDSFLNENDWKIYQSILQDVFLRKSNIHADEIVNYNSYLEEILKLVEMHVNIEYLDESKDILHRIRVKDVKYYLPYKDGHGFESVEQCMMQDHYVSKIRATVVYTTSKKTDISEGIKNLSLDEKNNDDDDDDSSVTMSDDDMSVDEDDDQEEEQEDNSSNGNETSNANETTFSFTVHDYSDYNQVLHETEIPDFYLFEMPIWLGTDICLSSTDFQNPFLYRFPYMQVGCFFMVKRSFKICPYEEYIRNNYILAKKSDLMEIRSKFYDPSRKYRTNSTIQCCLRTSGRKHFKLQSLQPRLEIKIPYETKNNYLPIAVLAMAYGWSIEDFILGIRMFLQYETSQQIETLITIIKNDLCDCKSQSDAIMKMSESFTKCHNMEINGQTMNDISSYVSYTLRGEFFPNLTNSDNNFVYENMRKGYLLANVCAKMILLSDIVNETKEEGCKYHLDNVLSYAFKRVQTPGEKMTILTRKYLKYFTKRGGTKLKDVIDNGKRFDIKSILNPNYVKLTSSVINGTWDSKTDAANSNLHKTQQMFTSFCSDFIHTEVQKIQKLGMHKNVNLLPLLGHPSQNGRVDPYKTPENHKCGSLRFKAIGARISPLIELESISFIILTILHQFKHEFGWHPLEKEKKFFGKEFTMVFDVKNGIIGWVKNPLQVYKRFVQFRRQGSTCEYLSIEWDRKYNQLLFNCDEGRLMRPLLVLENMHKLVELYSSNSYFSHTENQLQSLLDFGIIEYIDASEEYCGTVFIAESFQVAQKTNFEQTHMEIHPVFPFCLMIAKLFYNFNQGPRRLFTGNLETRVISLKIYPDRGTTSSHSLWYGQLPIIYGPVDKSMGLRENEPNGTNMVVAIMSMGENVEDAWILKKEAIERGFGISTEYNIISTTPPVNGRFGNPAILKVKSMNDSKKYENLDSDGIPIVKSFLPGGSAVIGKIFNGKNNVDRCISKFLPSNADYIVHSVEKEPKINPQVVRVTLRKTNWVKVGNKLCIPPQKGTCGRILPSYDLPFISVGPNKGIIPDLFLNVCSLSRITQSLLIESMLSKATILLDKLKVEDEKEIYSKLMENNEVSSSTSLMQYDTVFLNTKTLKDRIKLAVHVLKRMGLRSSGSEIMTCGKYGTRIQHPIYTGLVHVKILKHMAADKIRSRDSGPINELTKQASSGKKLFGGLRIGEMESSNANSYGAPFIYQNWFLHCDTKFTCFYCVKCELIAIGCIDTKIFLCQKCHSGQNICRLQVPYISLLSINEFLTMGLGYKYVVQQNTHTDIDEQNIYNQFMYFHRAKETFHQLKEFVVQDL